MNDPSKAGGTKEYSAFICHASADREKAEIIAGSLEEKGLTCWIAPRDVRPGAEYAEEIMRGIKRSKCLVLILSEAANLSAHVRREVERAASAGKAIYPVRIEEVPPSPKLEYFVSMHHWLDAWDGVLTQHATRLAAAIDSHEEWIGNKIVRRRRILSGGLVTIVAAVVLATAVVYGSDIRKMTMSTNERAREELRESGIPFDIEGLTRVVMSADATNLERFDRAGIGLETIQAAFSKPATAEGFFRASKGKSEAIDWFRSVLDRGFDPNATLPDAYYTSEGILRTVLREGNLDAALALLDAGASPHTYQNLWFTYHRTPMAVFPYAYVDNYKGFTKEEKGKLAAAFAEAGAVMALPAQGEEDQRPGSAASEMKEQRAQIKARYGVDVPVVSSICDARPTKICKSATERTGFDWCAFAAKLPEKLVSDADYYEFQTMELSQLVSVVDNKAYVLARLPSGYMPGYGLIEISKDGGNWTVYKYTAPAAGMGHCKKKGDYTPDDCWRRVELKATDKPDRMRMFDYYDFNLSFCPD